MSADSTTPDKTAKKLHVCFVGNPGLAKSELLKAAVGHMPNSKYESVQFATGKSLTVIVTKEEGDALILRIGPIPQAKGAIATTQRNGQNEPRRFGRIYVRIQCKNRNSQQTSLAITFMWMPTAIIASANPVGGSWKSYNDDNDSRIDLDKIPAIKPLVDRFDLIFTFKDNRSKDQLTEYADRKSEMEDKPTPDYTEYIAKHIMYAKQQLP